MFNLRSQPWGRLAPVLAGIALGLALGFLLPTQRAQETDGYATAVAEAAPSVVNIYTRKRLSPEPHPLCALPRFEALCRQLPGRRERMEGALGSGVILEARGLILTNNHVIADADDIIVVTAEGTEYPGRVLGTDPSTDLAVLQVTPDAPLSPARLRRTPLRVGDTVLAIGNPFGLGQTVSQGIVSALGRQTLGTSPYADFIQTDAAINPGNSGGALIDSHGALVGINTLIFSRSGSFEGIGFALPARLAIDVAREIEARGQVIRGWLGLEVIADNAEDGLLVTAIFPGGPAARAGLRPGDRLLALDGRSARHAREMAQHIASLAPGNRLELVIDRQGRRATLEGLVGQRP
ncbi:MAG: trypsin-like peptidase domain-containing protein [Pseudomonadales bacterium]|nr:trypsin-like peptidase domain-containing protein [Pseudomonadales bacterium]MBL6808210.1 trypsin-like peptidase domain-containing protein [Pseudomonadales bacterium]